MFGWGAKKSPEEPGKGKSAYGKPQPGAKKESTYGTTRIPRGVTTSAYKGKAQLQPTGQTAAGLAKDQLLEAMGPMVDKLRKQGYEPVKFLGEGSYAKVYQVSDSKGKQLAIKVISLKKNENHYIVEFLPRELKILMKLKHDYITTVYGISKDKRCVFIIMELASGGSIADLINTTGEIPEPETKNLFSKIIEAIHYMHSLGIAHRDLKLENLLLDLNKQPKLTDFSYSIDLKQVKIDPKTGKPALSKTFCGTPPYLPPEVLSNEPYDAKAADIWSLAVCLYIMLNNALPFKFIQSEEGMVEMVRLQMTKTWKIRSRVDGKVSKEVRDLLTNMFQPKPEERASSTAVILHKWLTGDAKKKDAEKSKITEKSKIGSAYNKKLK